MCSTDSISEDKKDLDDSGFVPMSCGDILCAEDASMCSRRVQLLDLSDDVLLYVLKHLTARDLKALGYSCSRLGRLVRERSLWRHVDARSEACSKARLAWLLDNALHADTHVLKLSGYARDADGCVGLVNITRKEAEQEIKDEERRRRREENNHSEHTTLLSESYPTNLHRIEVGMERHPARFYIAAQRTQFPRHRCSPLWPEDEEGGRVGPQRCSGPQFTFTPGLLQRLLTKCPHLTTLRLEYCNIDCSATGLGTFPKTLKKLSLRGTKCFNMPHDKTFLFKIQDYMPLLESLDVSECEWMDPATLLPLSKMLALQELLMRDCHKLSEFVAYASLTARYGFRTLKSLDLRGSPVGDSEVAALGWLPQLERLWLSARRNKRAEPHAHYADDERATHVQLHEWETHEPECFKQKSSPDTSIEDMESGMGEPIPSSCIADEEPGADNERSQSKDGKDNKDNKDDNNKKGSKRKPDDDTDNNGEPSCKHRRTGENISFQNNAVRRERNDAVGFCIFDEIEKACSRIAENIVMNNIINEFNDNEQQNDQNNDPQPMEFNLINPMDDSRESRNDNDNDRNQNNNENRPRCRSNENRENHPNNRPNNERVGGCLVDCIKIDQLIDASDVTCGRRNEVIVIAGSSRPKNEPSTSKQPDDKPKTPSNKPISLGYVHFRRNQNPVYVNINCGESNEDQNDKNDLKRQESNNTKKDDESKTNDCDKSESKTNDSDKVDDNKIGSVKVDDQKPGPSNKRVNEGASTSKENDKRVPIYVNCSPENVQRREPLPPVQYQIEPMHHVLYVGVGSQLNTYRFPRASSELMRHLNFRPSHIEESSLVTDFAMRRFGRADGEDVNVIHIGRNGPVLNGPGTGSRPDRSSLRFLSVTGYRNITDRSLVHLATAAPNLSFVDFSGTSVTENGAENFRCLRPDCDIVFSQFHENEEK